MAELPQNWIEIKLKHLIKFVIGGDWGTEKPSISNSERVAVIRGTDYKYWRYCSGNFWWWTYATRCTYYSNR